MCFRVIYSIQVYAAALEDADLGQQEGVHPFLAVGVDQAAEVVEYDLTVDLPLR